MCVCVYVYCQPQLTQYQAATKSCIQFQASYHRSLGLFGRLEKTGELRRESETCQVRRSKSPRNRQWIDGLNERMQHRDVADQ